MSAGANADVGIRSNGLPLLVEYHWLPLTRRIKISYIFPKPAAVGISGGAGFVGFVPYSRRNSATKRRCWFSI